VITASSRAAAGVYPDRTGPVIVAWLRERGFAVTDPVVVGDGAPVHAALVEALADEVAVVITTGGTGISPTDRTPEATMAVLDLELRGLADAVRAAGTPRVPTAALSRGVAGVAGGTLVVNLPGSTGGVRDGLGVLDGVLTHALDQIAGTDHRPSAPGSGEPATQVDDAGPDSEPAVDQSAAAESKSVVRRAAVVATGLSMAEHAALVTDDASGAVVTFAGVVRDHDHGRAVLSLDYEAHPSAGEVIGSVAAAVAGRHPGVRALAVSHRVGALGIGDVALACAVGAEHRGEAFAACAALVDEIKANLPVWKHQRFADGTDEWVNCP